MYMTTLLQKVNIIRASAELYTEIEKVIASATSSDDRLLGKNSSCESHIFGWYNRKAGSEMDSLRSKKNKFEHDKALCQKIDVEMERVMFNAFWIAQKELQWLFETQINLAPYMLNKGLEE